MADTIEYENPNSSYLVYGAETSYGAGATPANANKVGKINTFSWNANNNFLKSKDMGAGNNYGVSVLGNFDLSGSIDFDVDDFSIFKYLIGIIQGSGSIGTPYEIVEVDRIGYDSTNTTSVALELGTEGDANDDVLTFDGVVFGSGSINGSQGSTLKGNLDWTGHNITASTTLISYTASTSKPFVFQSGSVTIGTDAFHCTDFSVSIANNLAIFRDTGSGRFIAMPQRGNRDYTGSFTFIMKYDTTASVLSGRELRDFFFGASNTPDTGNSIPAKDLNISIDEGAAANDRVVDIELTNTYFDDWSQPVNNGDGTMSLTVGYHAHHGKSDSTDNVPIRFYTIS